MRTFIIDNDIYHMTEKNYSVMCNLINSGELVDLSHGWNDKEDKHGKRLEWIIAHSKLVDTATDVYHS
jgi:allantoicase